MTFFVCEAQGGTLEAIGYDTVIGLPHDDPYRPGHEKTRVRAIVMAHIQPMVIPAYEAMLTLTERHYRALAPDRRVGLEDWWYLLPSPTPDSYPAPPMGYLKALRLSTAPITGTEIRIITVHEFYQTTFFQMPVYTPTLDAMSAVKTASQPQGELLEWLESQGIRLAKYHEHTEACYATAGSGGADREVRKRLDLPGCGMHDSVLYTHNESVNSLLARMHGIDAQRADIEKRHLLLQQQAITMANEQEDPSAIFIPDYSK